MNDLKHSMKTQDKFTQHSKLHNGSLTTDEESIMVTTHQTIEQREEQESDMTKFRGTGTRALSEPLRLQAKRMLLIIPSTRAQVLKMNVDYNQIVL